MKPSKTNAFSVIAVTGFLCAVFFVQGCFQSKAQAPRNTLFIGLDVSGSFYKTPEFDDAVHFVSYYIYSHMNGLDGLKVPKALFVGSIGGDTVDEPKSFHPIHDFQGKSIEQIEKDLREWLPQSNKLTDFNIFLEKVAVTVKKQNLMLTPIDIVLISDGEPDMSNTKITDDKDRYRKLVVQPLEYLARSITIRLLYPRPVIADYWERLMPRHRVKLWTVDNEIMAGWKNQLIADAPIEQQTKLFTWIKDNIDFMVRAKRF